MTNSESRAIGGWAGSFATITTDKGAVQLERVGRTADDLVARPPLQLDMPSEFVARYGFNDLTTDVRPLFMTPDFPTAAKLMGQAYEQMTGLPVDGVVALDPDTRPEPTPQGAPPIMKDLLARLGLKYDPTPLIPPAAYAVRRRRISRSHREVSTEARITIVIPPPTCMIFIAAGAYFPVV